MHAPRVLFAPFSPARCKTKHQLRVARRSLAPHGAADSVTVGSRVVAYDPARGSNCKCGPLAPSSLPETADRILMEHVVVSHAHGAVAAVSAQHCGQAYLACA